MVDILNPNQDQLVNNQTQNSNLPPQPIPTPEPQLNIPPQQEIPPQNNNTTNFNKEEILTDGKVDPNKIKAFLQKYLVDKCPISIPENIKETMVKFSPILSLIGVIIGLPMILVFLGINAIALPFTSISSHGFSYYIEAAEIIINFIIEIILIPGLFKRTQKAWNLMFNFLGISLVFNILNLQFTSAIFSTAIGAYVLFQIRSKYIN